MPSRKGKRSQSSHLKIGLRVQGTVSVPGPLLDQSIPCLCFLRAGYLVTGLLGIGFHPASSLDGPSNLSRHTSSPFPRVEIW